MHPAILIFLGSLKHFAARPAPAPQRVAVPQVRSGLQNSGDPSLFRHASWQRPK